MRMAVDTRQSVTYNSVQSECGFTCLTSKHPNTISQLTALRLAFRTNLEGVDGEIDEAREEVGEDEELEARRVDGLVDAGSKSVPGTLICNLLD